MSFLSARDFTLVMLAIVFLAGAAPIALLQPLPAAANVWAWMGLSAIAILLLFLAVFPNCLRRFRQDGVQAQKESAQRIGRSAP